MTICVVTYESRNLNYKNCFRKNHETYCNHHKYKYIAFDNYDANYPVYWMKVKIVYDLLSQYEWVIWIDSDAMFIDKNIKFPLDSKHTFIISQDKPHHKRPSKINTGVFAVQSCPDGFDFMNKWIELFKNTNWKYLNGKWSCNGVYSGIHYEQGACIELLKTLDSNSYKILPWNVLNNHPRSHRTGCCYHFCGSFGKRKLKRFLYRHWRIR
uniref:Nucleotide-diphospho-sugar transferase domain-containing protein n=1 Tax=viral metagenome TaxID=1070528 RepID=A0A6C0F6A1_9ZZZZ|tara:strand:- start:718 stop:1350 length:633 start_codon:yes stop_codon:yes gene_type:complete